MSPQWPHPSSQKLDAQQGHGISIDAVVGLIVRAFSQDDSCSPLFFADVDKQEEYWRELAHEVMKFLPRGPNAAHSIFYIAGKGMAVTAHAVA